MRLLIDGYNLIRCTPLGGAERAGLEAARENALSLLSRYQRLRGHQVTVVFDGPSRNQARVGPVRIIYAPSADLEIKKLAGPGWTVVTSDREVAREAERRGATAIDSEAFWSKLGEVGEGRPAYPGGEARWAKDEDEEEAGDSRVRKKGTARRASKAERRRQAGLNKL